MFFSMITYSGNVYQDKKFSVDVPKFRSRSQRIQTEKITQAFPLKVKVRISLPERNFLGQSFYTKNF
jgi:hypothetical protein